MGRPSPEARPLPATGFPAAAGKNGRVYRDSDSSGGGIVSDPKHHHRPPSDPPLPRLSRSSPALAGGVEELRPIPLGDRQRLLLLGEVEGKKHVPFSTPPP